MKRRYYLFVFIALLLGGGYVFTPSDQRPAFLNRLEHLAYDLRLQWASTAAAIDQQVVVVDIDQMSQQRKGRWPWSRAVTAQLIDTLRNDYQVSSVGLDLYFPAEANCSVEADTVLSTTLQQQRDSIVMAVKLQTQPQFHWVERHDALGTGVRLLHQNAAVDKLSVPVALDFSGNLKKFLVQQPVIGHISPIVDASDSKVRRLAALYRIQTQHFDTLSLAMWRQMLAADALWLDDTLEHWLDAPKLRLVIGDTPLPWAIPVNQRAEVLIPYHARVQTVSAADVLDKRLPSTSLQGKLILIGSSAKAQGDDLVATPLHPELPGVEIHAIMLNAMLAQMEGNAGRFKVQPYYEAYWQLAFMLVAGICVLGLRALGVKMLLLSSPLILSTWLWINYGLWSLGGVAVDILPVAALLLSMTLYIGIHDLLDINTRHQHIRKIFSYYLPATVVQRLANDRKGMDWLKPERREMTVLFADVQGFTVLAEALTPEDVATLTQQLFTRLTAVIHAHHGTVDKYMGDAVMAFWGAPLQDDAHALHAVQAAQAMQSAIADLNAHEFAHENYRIRMGIGINTGSMVVGNLGSEQRHAYTVMGGVVNVASAMQQLTRTLAHNILFGAETARQLPVSLYREVGEVATKKSPQKVRVFTVSDTAHQ